MTRHAETKIDIAQIAAIVALVVRRDAELEPLFLEVENNLVHLPWMNRAR